MTLPKGWSEASLGDFTLERVEQGEPGVVAVPYIDIGSIDRNLKGVGPTENITSVNAPTRARQWVKSGDVLVSLTRPNLNAVAMVPPELDGAVASTGFDVLRTKGVLPEWVFNRVRSQTFVSDVCEGIQGVVYPAIRPADVRRHVLPIPPTQEQRRIVDAIDSCLTRLDDAVASLERVQAKLKAYRASVLKAAVEGRLVPTEAFLARAEKRAYEPAAVLLARILKERYRRWEEAELARLNAAGKTPKDDAWKGRYKEPVALDTSQLSQLPDGWTWASADQLTATITDGEHQTPPRCQSGVLLISARNVLNGEMNFETVDHITEQVYAKLSKRLKLEAGDVLLSCSGTIGRSCVVPAGVRFAMVRSVAVLKPLLGMGHFLSYCLRSPVVQGQIHRKKTQTAQSNIFQEKIRTLALPIAPLVEQERIVTQIDMLLSVCKATEDSIKSNHDRCGRLRQSILKWAFEGQLVDQDSTDEPADKLLARIRAERAGAAPAPKVRSRKA